MLQWYGIVPAVGNDFTAAAPGFSEPVSNWPLSPVAVCGMAVDSQFTHAMELPAFTCTVAGEKVKLEMNTSVAPAGTGGGVHVPGVVPALPVVCSEKHADTVPMASVAMTPTATTSRTVNGRMLI